MGLRVNKYSSATAESKTNGPERIPKVYFTPHSIVFGT